jgi:hypothetical protein
LVNEPASTTIRPPLVTFYRLIEEARVPQRADRSANGIIPTRAFRYCEAVVSASAFGYYIFPPVTFSVMWTGTEVIWTWEGESGWYPLSTAQFPGFRPRFDAAAPPEIREFSPPFIAALQEPGIIQVWSGMVARTAPGWSLLVRPLANMPRSQYYEFFEGIIETDRWFGPLFINLRLTKTDVPIEIRADYPLFQAQPLPRDVYGDETLNNYIVKGSIEDLGAEEWAAYFDTVVRPNVQTHRPRGQYAIVARKRRASEDVEA